MPERKLLLPFYTLAEVAKITGKSTRTIFRMLADGRLTAEKDNDGKYIFQRETVETYLQAQTGDKIAQAKQVLPALQAFCIEHRPTGCDGCPFGSSSGCTIDGTPDGWRI